MSDVYLYLYDLSNGFAQIITQQLPSPTITAIWHSSIVVYGKEIDYGTTGIEIIDVQSNPKSPRWICKLGHVDYEWKDISVLLSLMGQRKYKDCNYNVVLNNCHCFSNEFVQKILKTRIPQHLLDLPADVTVAIMGCFGCLISKSKPGLGLSFKSPASLTSVMHPENMGLTENVSNSFKF